MRKPSQPAKPEPEPEKFERWIAQRKAAIILELLKGQISGTRKPAPSTASRRTNSVPAPTSITAAASTRSRSTRRALRLSIVSK